MAFYPIIAFQDAWGFGVTVLVAALYSLEIVPGPKRLGAKRVPGTLHYQGLLIRMNSHDICYMKTN